MTPRWPIKVLPAQNVAFNIAPRSKAGVPTAYGRSQVIASDAGFWRVTFESILVRDRDSVLAFRTMAGLLEGRLNPVLVPLCRGYQPSPIGGSQAYRGVPHSDMSPFQDESLYRGSAISADMRSGLALRATSASINLRNAERVEPGQHFSICERLYRLRSVVHTSATRAEITFRPPLREAVPAGTALNFDDPVCRMKLATDEEMDLTLQLRRAARPTVNFVEDF